MRGTVEWSVLSMNSQRLREQRIEERLQGGALALATPSDRVQATPTSDKVCHGCLEPNADARVGDQAGPGITPARSRWVIVVPVGRADRYAALRRRFGRSPWVDVVMDRRRGERSPHDVGGAVVERRAASRRKPVSNAPTPAPRFRLAHQLEGCDVYEATSPESGRCPDCGVVVSLELPRFAEPPVRLELVLRHEPTAHGVRHVGECQSLSATGRVLLSMRLVGRVSSGPP